MFSLRCHKAGWVWSVWNSQTIAAKDVSQKLVSQQTIRQTNFILCSVVIYKLDIWQWRIRWNLAKLLFSPFRTVLSKQLFDCFTIITSTPPIQANALHQCQHIFSKIKRIKYLTMPHVLSIFVWGTDSSRHQLKKCASRRLDCGRHFPGRISEI